VQRLFSQPAIIFKGSGFYVTDNGRNGRSTTSSNKRKSDKAKAKD
jgi:predicted nucleic acid-binding Zn ribbon protein